MPAHLPFARLLLPLCVLLAACAAPPPDDDTEHCTLVKHDDGSGTLTCGDTTFELPAGGDGGGGGSDAGTPSIERVVGSLTIQNSFDAAMYAGVKEITGNLLVADLMGLETLELPALEKLGGTMEVSAQSTLKRLSLPRLESALGVVMQYQAVFEEFSAPNLVTIEEGFSLGGTPVIRTLDLPRLARIGHTLWLQNLDGAPGTTLRFDALAEALQVSLQDVSANVSVAFPALVTGGTIMLANVGKFPLLPVLKHVTGLEFQSSANSFTTIDLPLLETIAATEGYALIVQNMTGVTAVRIPNVGPIAAQFSVTSNPDLETFEVGTSALRGACDFALNPKLRTVRFPRLAEISGSLEVYQHPELATFEAPLLRVVSGRANFHENPALSQCTIDTLEAALTTGEIASADNLRCD